MKMMKQLVTGLAVATGLALTAPAALADGYVGAKGGYKAPVYEAPVRWSTLYFGGHVGYSMSDADWTFLDAGFWNNAAGDRVGFSNEGWIAGGQIGLQHQFGSWVAGIEFTLSGGDKQDRIVSPFFPATDTLVTDMRWMFGAAARLGYTWDRWLVYGKVGFASASLSLRGEFSTNPARNDNSSEVHTGWLVGTGFEYMLRDHISIGLDYTYMDLGSATHGWSNPLNAPGTRIDVDLDGVHNIVARINFHLHRGGHDAPKPLK